MLHVKSRHVFIQTFHIGCRFRLSHVGVCAALILLATIALLLVSAILFPVLVSSPPRGGHENEFLDATHVIATTTASSNSSISIPPECVDKPCLPESFYFKAQPQGLFSWQVPPCSDFYSFVCTEDLLNRTHPQWLPYKHASVGIFVPFCSALRPRKCQDDRHNGYRLDRSDYLLCTTARPHRRLLAPVRRFCPCWSPSDLEAFLSSRSVENTPGGWTSPIALSLRLLDVAPFFHLKLPDVHAEYQDILASADTEVVAGHTVRTAVKDLLPIHYWQWESFLNTALKGARSFEQSSLVMVENMRYVRKIAVIMGQYEL
ncbi:hypothetical protein MRX96_059127 [Rhipicephalus microplus]